MANLFKTKGTFNPDSLIAGNEYPILSEGIILAHGQGLLKRGSLIGKFKDGKGYLSGTAINETETVAAVDGVLTDDFDTDSETEIVGTMFITGIFNEKALIIAEGAELTEFEKEMKRLGIYTRNVQEYEE